MNDWPTEVNFAAPVTHDLTREDQSAVEDHIRYMLAGVDEESFCDNVRVGDVMSVVREVAALRRQVEDARRTAEYWKAEHLAANAENATLRAKAEVVTDEMMADAMMAFQGWDVNDEMTEETRRKLRDHFLAPDGIGKRDRLYSAVKLAVAAAYAQARPAQGGSRDGE